MALFEDFVEPFDDLSQWTILIGGQASAIANRLEINLTGGVAQFNILHTTETFEIQDSWVSIRVPGPGLTPADFNDMQCQVGLYDWNTNDNYMLAVFIDEAEEALIINDPGNDNLQVELDISAQPYVAFSGADGDLTIWTSEDGVTWSEQFTGPSPFSGPMTLTIAGHNSTGDYPDPYQIAFESVNEFSPFAPVTTEVYKSNVSTWMVQPYYLRHYSWHVHHTVFKYLEVQLGSMGWTSDTEAERPFGAVQVKMQETLPPEFEETRALSPGTLAVTLGDEPDTNEEELGGVLNSHALPIFVDIFMDDEALALALANDVRDIFKGRAPGSSRWLQIINWAAPGETPAPGYTVELEDVTRDRPEGKLNWQVVKVTAVLYFNEVTYV